MLSSSGRPSIEPEPKRLPPVADATYDRLRRIASHLLTRERRGHTLGPTALVHEAYLRLPPLGPDEGGAALSRAAAAAMRLVLVDHARARRAAKRGAARKPRPLDEAVRLYEANSLDLVAVDEALRRLERFDPELAAIVDLRFFGGLGEEEIAAVLSVSARTVRRGWRAARLFLARELSDAR